MPQYFIEKSLSPGIDFEIKGRDFQHLSTVRRINTGDKINVRDGSNSLFECTVTGILKGCIMLHADMKLQGTDDVPDVTLVAALLKNKNFEFVLQKSTEIGISAVIPLVSERTVVNPGKENNKHSRWNTIIEEASKQSLRPDIPYLQEIITFNGLVDKYPEYERIIAHLDSAAPSVRQIVAETEKSRFLLAIGPEGGFSPSEIEKAVKSGWKCVYFGFTQMRAETASIVLSSILINEILEKKNKVL
ncbi:MAG: 16S rRNA (uracil(1498)-N(3))-methyltransferase [Spirochaetes bacterium]|nr:16S rRNA (uracil(1498)-N(3))-methyltransferase [Spirochaetota bacterium]